MININMASSKFFNLSYFFSVNEIVRPRIKVFSCLESFIQPEIIEQFFNASLNQRTTAQKYIIL